MEVLIVKYLLFEFSEFECSNGIYICTVVLSSQGQTFLLGSTGTVHKCRMQ
jgi:hypothetical protein